MKNTVRKILRWFTFQYYKIRLKLEKDENKKTELTNKLIASIIAEPYISNIPDHYNKGLKDICKLYKEEKDNEKSDK